MKLLTFLFLSSLVLANLKDNGNNYLPIFNLKSGFYNSYTIELTISIEDSKATIYYTMDGNYYLTILIISTILLINILFKIHIMC